MRLFSGLRLVDAVSGALVRLQGVAVLVDLVAVVAGGGPLQARVHVLDVSPGVLLHPESWTRHNGTRGIRWEFKNFTSSVEDPDPLDFGPP